MAGDASRENGRKGGRKRRREGPTVVLSGRFERPVADAVATAAAEDGVTKAQALVTLATQGLKRRARASRRAASG